MLGRKKILDNIFLQIIILQRKLFPVFLMERIISSKSDLVQGF